MNNQGIITVKVDQKPVNSHWLDILYKGIEKEMKPARNDGKIFINRSKDFPV